MERRDAQLKDEIQFPGLPLAVYREIAVHIGQVEGVQTGLYSASTEQFDYNQSQVRSLWIQYADSSPQSRKRVEQILAYYRELYSSV